MNVLVINCGSSSLKYQVIDSISEQVLCKGLCERCGANLNDGPCGCKATADPRLAVLEQLLDK